MTLLDQQGEVFGIETWLKGQKSISLDQQPAHSSIVTALAPYRTCFVEKNAVTAGPGALLLLLEVALGQGQNGMDLNEEFN